ncbi:glycoside hydrolase family 43 protein [Halomonas sp. WWR20]
MSLSKLLIEQRADPFIHKHDDGCYYFTASVPAYDRIELRRASTIEGLADAEAITAWRKPDTGPLGELIWAPEIHFHQGTWYVYFAAAPTREIKDGLFQHRMYCISTSSENPLEGHWGEPVQIETGIDSFCLDATTFEHHGTLYYVWAQKDPDVPGNSNLYIAAMEDPTRISGKPVRLSVPEHDWENRGFKVNEGPALIARKGRVWLSYSASATDENYCVGLLHADEDADLLNPSNWSKHPSPVFRSNYDKGVYGPGHNSFTVSEDGNTDLLVYHARTYREIQGDPLWDPNRHTFIKPITWRADGFPDFGEP